MESSRRIPALIFFFFFVFVLALDSALDALDGEARNRGGPLDNEW
jgi:hypothetical protein